MFDLNTAGARQALRMQQPDEVMEVQVRYQGRIVDITFLPDEDGTQPTDPNDRPVTDEQAKGWLRGEWWYHHIMVHIRNHDGWEIDDVKATCDSYSRLPSFAEPYDIIVRLCDDLLKEHPF
ncbi:TPA: hypothetical protein QEM39_000410 [Pseudomonas putida]|uniref:hypothetical protein n=1 Tax=Pseudomonas putida TaxID=303 RepID=UPI002364249B|nr:hypothetical protein [Pseudomonas putida]MDD2152248.1 hypothetical protein [Pseudomonas putida]HDS1678942.1 hypothetical protein [Pseudomonas putida]